MAKDLFQYYLAWESSPEWQFEQEATRWWVVKVCRENGWPTTPPKKMPWLDETCGPVTYAPIDGRLMAAWGRSRLSHHGIMQKYREMRPPATDEQTAAKMIGAKVVAMYREHLEEVTEPCVIVDKVTP